MSLSRNARETFFTLGYVLFGVAGAVAAGFLTHGAKFTGFPRPMLPFLIVGLVYALIHAAVQMRGFGMVLLVFVLFFLGQLALAGSLRGPALVEKVVGAAIYVLPIGSALILSAYLFRALGRIPFGKFIISAVVVAFGFVVMVVLWLMRQGAGLALPVLGAQAWIGAKIGAGIGLGLELVEAIGGKRPSPPGMPES